ncbi:MAG: 16S rRNA (guanine(966)-N(2))-methyltransferase RsmD [Ectothiorhodospiraceae bacterium AqS1]|nr:16S rRNA (guanine(966)-N(2))-methyltransferase RsmD [Ectothiorhodospiraceae bacterium AqS1]
MSSGTIRIIAGRWRRRSLPVADSIGLRPTPARVRETLFNWLQDEIEGRICLDLFAGTGALGFEAASRGAKEVVMVERKKDLARAIEKAASDFGAGGSVRVFCADARTWRPTPDQRFDLVFLDPPWSGPAPREALKRLEEVEAIAPCALACIEGDKTKEFTVPAGWTLRRDRCAGQVRYGLFERDRPPPSERMSSAADHRFSVGLGDDSRR